MCHWAEMIVADITRMQTSAVALVGVARHVAGACSPASGAKQRYGAPFVGFRNADVFFLVFDLGFDSPSCRLGPRPAEVDPSQGAVPGAPPVITAPALGTVVVIVRPKDIHPTNKLGCLLFLHGCLIWALTPRAPQR